jgi:electron transfer flavoprotein beta subunit
MLREAISVGADDAVLLSDIAFAGSDTLATSYTLSKAIEKLKPCDLVICGRQTIDGDTGQVGPELSEALGVPFIAYVSKVEDIKDGRLRVQRMVEDGYETIEASLPAVITVVKEINRPRLPSLRGQMCARNAKIPVWKAADIDAEAGKTGLDGSATQVIKVFFPQRTHRAEMIQGDPATQADRLIGRLREAKVI